MEILSYEYNEYVIGYVIKTDKGDINIQFDKCFSNHPEPAYKLSMGCEGDDTSRHLTDEDRDIICNFMDSCEEMHELEKKFTVAMYNGSGFAQMCAPIEKWEIEEASEYEEEDME